MFSVFCGLWVLTCIVATIMDILCKPVNVEIVEDDGNSMDEDANEKTHLLSEAKTRAERGKGNITVMYNYDTTS